MLNGLVIVAGIALGINAVNESIRLDDVHKKLGIALFVLYSVHYWAAPSFTSENPRPLHSVLGLLIIHHRPRLLASKGGVHARVPGVDDGQDAEGGERVSDLVGCVPVVDFAGLALVPRQFKQDGAARPGKQHIGGGSLSGGSTAGIVYPGPEMTERRGSAGSA
ncbi:hypothetical protein FIBSPDRAFT_126952 [Athelia psychrophila]|uniref:Cytochrome b561 domain-containing protein n=1 Tax=Athelia psychrophila TaxID=1759441 RepID=A0A166T862_9AGAM|nr:hypothetical protein FIBSPDRAFT_126952 [Fibularhizoctonia sp. CBS 109695]